MDFPEVTLVLQVGLPSDADAYTHRVGRTARAGKDGRAILMLTEIESFYLKVNPQFPIVPYPDADAVINDASSADVMAWSLGNVDENIKRKAYSAYLGFMKAFCNKLRLKPEGLVAMANRFALDGMLCNDIPEMEKKTVG